MFEFWMAFLGIKRFITGWQFHSLSYGKGKENCNLSESREVFLEDMHLMTDPLRYFKGSMKKKVN